MLSDYWISGTQDSGTQDSISFPTGLWKITVLPLSYHYILEASELGSIDSNETILDGTVVKCGIFGEEWL